MKFHRFIGGFDLNKKQLAITDPELVNQIKNVLRLRSGEQIILCDGTNNEARAEIVEVRQDQILVKIEQLSEIKNESTRRVTLYCAVLKKENFELVAQKATEIGVAVIVPVITKRTVKLNLNQDRLNKIIREAAEQSGRGQVPELREPIEFETALNQDVANYLFDLGAGQFQKTNDTAINIWIGPEGGWDPEEVEKAKQYKFNIVGLGPLTLRAETAAIVATYLALQ